MYDLINRLWIGVKTESVMGKAILYGIQEGETKGVLDMIKSQAQDNYPLMETIVGTELLKDIVTLKND